MATNHTNQPVIGKTADRLHVGDTVRVDSQHLKVLETYPLSKDQWGKPRMAVKTDGGLFHCRPGTYWVVML